MNTHIQVLDLINPKFFFYNRHALNMFYILKANFKHLVIKFCF